VVDRDRVKAAGLSLCLFLSHLEQPLEAAPAELPLFRLQQAGPQLREKPVSRWPVSNEALPIFLQKPPHQGRTLALVGRLCDHGLNVLQPPTLGGRPLLILTETAKPFAAPACPVAAAVTAVEAVQPALIRQNFAALPASPIHPIALLSFRFGSPGSNLTSYSVQQP